MPNKDAGFLPSPWNEFLKELDNDLTEPLEPKLLSPLLVLFTGAGMNCSD